MGDDAWGSRAHQHALPMCLPCRRDACSTCLPPPPQIKVTQLGQQNARLLSHVALVESQRNVLAQQASLGGAWVAGLAAQGARPQAACLSGSSSAVCPTCPPAPALPPPPDLPTPRSWACCTRS